MFLVQHNINGATYLVFVHEEPSDEDCRGKVTKDVTLDNDGATSWPPGGDAPDDVVGRNSRNATEYKRFGSEKACKAAGYVVVPGNFAGVYASWSKYLGSKALLDP
jgi:hypothetical protein